MRKEHVVLSVSVDDLYEYLDEDMNAAIEECGLTENVLRLCCKKAQNYIDAGEWFGEVVREAAEMVATAHFAVNDYPDGYAW